MVRPLKASIESWTKPASLSVSVWIATCTSYFVGHRQRAIDGGRRGAPILVQFESDRAGQRSARASGAADRSIALAEKSQIHRQAFGGLAAYDAIFQGPGVQVVALVPVAGPVPPPINVVTPPDSASQTSCGQMK